MNPKTPKTTAARRSIPAAAVPPVPPCPRLESPGGTRPERSALQSADARDGRPLTGKAPVTPSGAPDAGAADSRGGSSSAGLDAGPAVDGESAAGLASTPHGIQRIAAAMSEDELERGMRRILKDLPGLLAYHTRDSRKSPGGFPDWCLCGSGGVLFRELKRQGKKPTPAQDEWLAGLAAAGADAGVWRPLQLLDGTIARELAALAGLVSGDGTPTCERCGYEIVQDGAGRWRRPENGMRYLYYCPGNRAPRHAPAEAGEGK